MPARNDPSLPELLQAFQAAFVGRNPALARLVRPGLPPGVIRERLADAGVAGDVEPMRALYSWSNGLAVEPDRTLVETSPFPESIYQYVDLDRAEEQFRMIAILREFHPRKRASEFVRYFPVFWDGSTGCLGVDTELSRRGRVVRIESESEQLFRPAYSSFRAFLADATRANLRNRPLRVFAW